MREHKINALDNFICGWYTDPQVSDDISENFILLYTKKAHIQSKSDKKNASETIQRV